jgi:ATP-dependent DNA helicase RecG
LNIKDLYSALWYVPVRYEDRRLNTSIKTSIPGKAVALKVKVVESSMEPDAKYPISVLCEDGTGYLSLKYRFKDKRALLSFKKGTELIVYGKLMEYKGEKYMVHPELLKEEEAGKVLPFYNIRVKSAESMSAKLRHKKVRQAIQKLLEYLRYMPEYLPEELLKKHNLYRLPESLYFLHAPHQWDERLNSWDTPAHHRLIYEDLLLFQLALQLKRREIKSLRAPKLLKGGGAHTGVFKKPSLWANPSPAQGLGRDFRGCKARDTHEPAFARRCGKWKNGGCNGYLLRLCQGGLSVRHNGPN